MKYAEFAEAVRMGRVAWGESRAEAIYPHEFAGRHMAIPHFIVTDTPELADFEAEFHEEIMYAEIIPPFEEFAVVFRDTVIVVNTDIDGTLSFLPFLRLKEGIWVSVVNLRPSPDGGLDVRAIIKEGKIPEDLLDHAAEVGALVKVLCYALALPDVVTTTTEVSVSARLANAKRKGSHRLPPSCRITINVERVAAIRQARQARKLGKGAEKSPHDRRSHLRRIVGKDGTQTLIRVVSSKIRGGSIVPKEYVLR